MIRGKLCKKVVAVTLSSLSTMSACLSMGERVFEQAYGDAFIGKQIAEVIARRGSPTEIRATDKGTSVYVYPYRLDRPNECTIFWEVRNERIVGMTHTGKGCMKGPFND